MSWGAWMWLLAVPLVGLLGVVMGLGALLRRRRWQAVVSPAVLDRLVPTSVRVRRGLRDLAALAGVALAMVALAEPRFDKQIRTVKTSGTDLVLLLDLSRSMDARDVDPSRLERARREVRDLGQLMAGDRVGLVVFAGAAYPRLPLTADYSALELVVSEAGTDTFEAQGSDLGMAIDAALSLLSRSQDKAGQAIVVLSDGETHDRDSAMAAAVRASQASIPIYAMGIGYEEAPIPLPNGRELEHGGVRVTTIPDFGILEEVARATGGAFVTSTASNRDMQGLYTEIRSSLKAVERGAQQRETWRSAFQWPLSVSAFLLLFAAWIGDGRRPWGAAAAVALCLQLSSSPAFAADPLFEADQLFQNEQFGRAAEKLTELSLENPGDPTIFDRLGAARYRAGDWEGAVRAYDQATRLRGPSADSLFNSGNAHYQAGRLEEAQERFEEVLEHDPQHPGAVANRDLVVREIEERRRIQPEPPPQDGGEGDEDGDGEEGEESDGGGKGQQGGDPQQREGTDEEGDPSDGPPSQAEEASSSEGKPTTDSHDPGGTPTGEGDQPPDEPGTSEAVGMDDLDPVDGEEGPPVDAEGDGTMGEDGGPITSGQAHRLLDAIEEGSQRVQVRGGSEDKPW